MATVFGEESDQRVHAFEARAVDNEAALLPALRQSSAGQPGEVEGQGGRRQVELLPDLACGHSFRPRLHQQPEDRQTGFLRQGGKGLDGLLRFHVSRIMEMKPLVKPRGGPFPEGA